MPSLTTVVGVWGSNQRYINYWNAPPRGDKFSPPKNRESISPLQRKNALKCALLMVNFPYFLPNIPLSESNYIILYGKSAEKGHFFPLFGTFVS